MDFTEYLKRILDSLTTEAIAGLIVVVKGVVTAGAVSVLAQQSVEWLYGPVADAVANGSKTGWRSILASPVMRRRVAMLVGVFAVVIGHSVNVPDFGPGPGGYLKACFFGFLGGGFASTLHDKAKGIKWIPTRG